MRIISAHTLLEAAVGEVLDSRSSYDGSAGTDHTGMQMALELYRATYGHVQFNDPASGYVLLACLKMARALIAAKRGEFHTDSVLDLAGYVKLATDCRQKDLSGPEQSEH